MTKLTRSVLIFSTVLPSGLLLLYRAFVGSTNDIPRPQPPPGATNVYFHEWIAWQSWDYLYRFDAAPQICQQFATGLMKRQSHRTTHFALRISGPTNKVCRFVVGHCGEFTTNGEESRSLSASRRSIGFDKVCDEVSDKDFGLVSDPNPPSSASSAAFEISFTSVRQAG
jgi:hypothetical protein